MSLGLDLVIVCLVAADLLPVLHHLAPRLGCVRLAARRELPSRALGGGAGGEGEGEGSDGDGSLALAFSAVSRTRRSGDERRTGPWPGMMAADGIANDAKKSSAERRDPLAGREAGWTQRKNILANPNFG